MLVIYPPEPLVPREIVTLKLNAKPFSALLFVKTYENPACDFFVQSSQTGSVSSALLVTSNLHTASAGIEPSTFSAHAEITSSAGNGCARVTVSSVRLRVNVIALVAAS